MHKNLSKPFFNSNPILVLELSSIHTEQIRLHLKDLGESDRLLRFGMFASDEFLDNYVDSFDFFRDVFFGVFEQDLNLVGFAHLAYSSNAFSSSNDAEFGVSVSTTHRGIGIGTALFKRAAIHCRNSNINILQVHCLSTNDGMMHIAKKAGMLVERSHGEAEAFLRIMPGNTASVIREALEAQAAIVDYTIKRSVKQGIKIAKQLYRFPKLV
jgi:RimJ/RimL family protein N-acetyltransferase